MFPLKLAKKSWMFIAMFKDLFATALKLLKGFLEDSWRILEGFLRGIWSLILQWSIRGLLKDYFGGHRLLRFLWRFLKDSWRIIGRFLREFVVSDFRDPSEDCRRIVSVIINCRRFLKDPWMFLVGILILHTSEIHQMIFKGLFQW